jgi:membrane fusion protein (multidrug efflux system)
MSQRHACGLLVLAAAAPLSSLASCAKRPSSAAMITAVRVAELRPERVGVRARFSASVKPRQTVDLSFKVPGTVERLYRVKTAGGERDVQQGDVVPKDAVIAALELRDYEREVELAKAKVERADAALVRAKASASSANRDYQRVRELGNIASAKELDDAEARRAVADAEVAVAEKEVAAARVAQQQANDRLSDCTLRVPIEHATVVVKDVEPQERVATNTLAFRIIDISVVRVAFGVPDSFLEGVGASELAGPRISIGQDVQAFAEGIEGARFQGRITMIAPAADETTRTFLTEVSVDNSDGRLKPGMVLTVNLVKEREAFLVPMTAVQRGVAPGETAVYRLVGSGRHRVERRRVTVLGITDNRAELDLPAGEIAAGDRIVVAGAARVTDGVEVRVLDEGARKAIR